MRRVRVVVQSRLNSSRLPGKAMLDVAGMPMIELVARRAARSGHEVVVATSDERYDQRIAHHLRSAGISVVQGDLDDVLGRFVLAADGLDDDDRVVRLTGDNPLADADLIDELLAAMDASGHTYGRVDIEQVPEGIGCEGFTARALREAAEQASAPYDREHVTPWLRRELGELLFVPQGCPSDLRGYRATVDCLDDFDRVTRLFDGIADPVGEGWLPLMTRLGERLAQVGGTVPLAGAGVSRLVLDAASLQDIDGATGRATFSAAVEQGVTHVLADAGALPLLARLRSATEPALVQRLGVLLQLPRTLVLDGDDPAAARLRLELALERAFATLGRRRVDTVLLPGALLPAGREWLAEIVGSGLAARAGVVLDDPDELLALGEITGDDVLGVLVLRAASGHPEAREDWDAWEAAADRIAECRRAGTVVVAALDHPGSKAELRRWVEGGGPADAVGVGCTSATQVAASVAALRD